MAGLEPINGVFSPCDHQDANLTVLKAFEVGDDSIPRPVVMTKKFFLGNDGSLQKTSYQDAFTFEAFRTQIVGIKPMGELLHAFANDQDRNWAIIKGINEEPHLESTRRRDEIFPEHPEGTDWVMLDIDNIPVPNEITPYSKEAISWLIQNKLPEEFRNVTSYFQFSSSAGICKVGGELLKSGLCAHLFFFLDRRVQGKRLAAHLRLHCMSSGFSIIDNNKGGVATITHGIDPAPIRSAVQLHYISNPLIAKGVTCKLTEQNRDGFIEGDRETVPLPELPANIISSADSEQNRLLTAWKEANGYKKVVSQVHTENGIVTATHYKPTTEGVVKTGRNLVDVKMTTWKTSDDICTLILDDENSPGSWYVLKVTPHLARRRDGVTVPLKEFSEGAYEYVRVELQWLIDVPYRACELTAEGRLPEIDSFATAKHSLILAPTGSGKTYSMIAWMAEKCVRNLVIYIAQTIPLVDQMAADLTKKDMAFEHYNSFDYSYTPRNGIFLTTNESLYKILEAVGMSSYVLVVDELHRALDDFATGDERLNRFKIAITQAVQVVYMTGTLTAIQRNMMAEIVSGILGRRMTTADYCCYEFSSVKQNPLHILNLNNFQSDLIGLIEGYANLHSEKKAIPNTVLIMNTAKMELFNQMVSHYGLEEVIEVVSRRENLPSEIEVARTTSKPILIASPLFSIGLNFGCEPEVLWCRFDRLEADTSQIVQTINRANRGQVRCSVRIYAGAIDQNPFVFPLKKKVRAKLATMIEDESELSNLGYDMPMMLDRLVYNEYRKIEKNTQKSMGMLMRDNAFQNYVVAPLHDVPKYDKAKHKKFGEFRTAAKEQYDQSVIDWYNKIIPNRDVMYHLEKADRLAMKHGVNYKAANPKTDREFQEKELAIIMHICQLENPAQARKVTISKLKLLFGMREPWMSDSRKAGKFSQSKKASALKLKELVYLGDVIGQLATGELDGVSFAVKLNKDKKIQKGFSALANNERDFFSINESFEKLSDMREVFRASRSIESRLKAEHFSLNLMVDLLGEIGVFFAVEGEGRDKHVNYEKPLVPTSWDFRSMITQLELLAESLNNLPDDMAVEWSWAPCNSTFNGIMKCFNCKSFYLGRCLRGNAVDFKEWGIQEPLGIDLTFWNQCREHDKRRGG